MRTERLFVTLMSILMLGAVTVSAQPPYLQSQTYDVGLDFGDYSHTYFFADTVYDVDPSDASGHINWKGIVCFRVRHSILQ